MEDRARLLAIYCGTVGLNAPSVVCENLITMAALSEPLAKAVRNLPMFQQLQGFTDYGKELYVVTTIFIMNRY